MEIIAEREATNFVVSWQTSHLGISQLGILCPWCAAAALVVSLFHTGISRVPPAYASPSKAKACREPQSGAKNRSLRKWSLWKAKKEASRVNRKDSDSEVTMPCHFGARQKLQHLASVYKLLIKHSLPPFVHLASSSALLNL